MESDSELTVAITAAASEKPHHNNLIPVFSGVSCMKCKKSPILGLFFACEACRIAADTIFSPVVICIERDVL